MATAQEAERLDALHELDVLDSLAEDAFDGLVRAAAVVCGVPISSLVLVDADRNWFKAQVGLGELREIPRETGFCAHAITGDDILEVPDAAQDPRFAASPLVTGESRIRFYAGAPVRVGGGHRVGTVCVLDQTPRVLDPQQRDVLRGLAVVAGTMLEHRKMSQSNHRLARSLERALAELAAHKDHLRHLYEATPAMLHSIDAEGRLAMVSDTWLAKLGYRRDEVVGRPSTDFLTERSRQYAEQVVLPAFFETGRCADIAYQMVAKDGTVIDVLLSAAAERDADGRISRSLTAIDDVTSRLGAERALREGETRYRMLAESTNDVITRLDLDLVRQYVSPACLRVLGYRPDELTGSIPLATVHPDDRAGLDGALAALKGGAMPGDRVMTTHRQRHKLGHWVWIEAGLNLVRDPDTGAPRHIIGALRDVSERRRIAEELEQARTAAERAVESKTEFVANMSHELRTPLTGILGIHDILRRDPELNLRHRRYVTLAHEAGQSLMAIINNVLDFSKIEAGQLRLESVPCDLRALVEASCDFVRGEAAKKGLLIEAHLSADLTLLGDPVRLRQVLLNLIANAVKFTAGGLVWIEADYNAEAGRLQLSVSDTGIGIAADQLATIFERFRQADGSITRQYGGTGLGLAICKRLVELMGGTIEVRSVLGAGSTFTVDIPAKAIAAELPSEPQPDIAVTTPCRVLLVEDNSLNQTIIAEMLRYRGHTVALAENGLEAIEAATGAEQFDVILMDVQMPVLDGFSATRGIRDRQVLDARPRVPIIGLTANASERDRELCLAAGMDARVTKPIDWSNLFALMDELAVAGHGGRAGRPQRQGPVLDRSTRDNLATIIGHQRLDAMLQTFLAELRTESDRLPAMGEADVGRLAHGWASMAGHLGFTELGERAADVDQDFRAGNGLVRLPDLRRAICRALATGDCRDPAVAA